MFLRFEATLNGKKFSDIAPEVILLDILEQPADMDVSLSRRGYRSGQRSSGRVRTSLSVRLVYNIRAYSIERRAAIRDMIADWAKDGGWLTVNSRPGKRLFVEVDNPPNLDSSLKWTQDLSLTLTAYSQPYWEDEEDVRVGAVDAAWSPAHQQYYAANVITPTGNVPTVPLSVSFYASGGAPLTHIKIVADDTFIELDNLSVQPSLVRGYVFIDYDDNDVLMIHDLMADDDNSSLMSNRTAESSDDLLVRCGKTNQLHVYSDVPVTVTFWAKGRWV